MSDREQAEGEGGRRGNDPLDQIERGWVGKDGEGGVCGAGEGEGRGG